MNSLLVLILAAAGIVLGYFVYARHIDRKVIQPDAKKATPARMYMDGVDFTPANRNVLFGYQFKSIAALGPITGPIIAVQWGWLPALAWVILGTFFIGWVQDYGAMMMGVRRDGETMGALSYKLISPRARRILMIFIYFYLLLIMGSFGNAVGKTLMTNPKNPLGMIIVVLMGILGGQMTYKWRRDIILTTVVTVVISFVGHLGEHPAGGGRLLHRGLRRGQEPGAVPWQHPGAGDRHPAGDRVLLPGLGAADLVLRPAHQLHLLLDRQLGDARRPHRPADLAPGHGRLPGFTPSSPRPRAPCGRSCS